MVKSKTRKNNRHKFLIIPLLVFICFLIFLGIYGITKLKQTLLKQTADKNEYFSQMVEQEKLMPETQKHVDTALSKLNEAKALTEEPVLTEEEKGEIKTLLQEAVVEAKLATDLEPQKSITWGVLGYIYYSLMGSAENAPEFAIESYTKAIELNPNVVTYHKELGGVYMYQGKYDLAIDEFKKETGLTDKDPNSFYNLGVAYKAYGAKTQAKEAFEKALNLSPKNDPQRYKIEAQIESL